MYCMLQQSAGFQPINLVPRPPHLQGLYGNQHPGNHFGYGKGAGVVVNIILEILDLLVFRRSCKWRNRL
jgi:hypothetical protein